MQRRWLALLLLLLAFGLIAWLWLGQKHAPSEDPDDGPTALEANPAIGRAQGDTAGPVLSAGAPVPPTLAAESEQGHEGAPDVSVADERVSVRFDLTVEGDPELPFLIMAPGVEKGSWVMGTARGGESVDLRVPAGKHTCTWFPRPNGPRAIYGLSRREITFEGTEQVVALHATRGPGSLTIRTRTASGEAIGGVDVELDFGVKRAVTTDALGTYVFDRVDPMHLKGVEPSHLQPKGTLSGRGLSFLRTLREASEDGQHVVLTMELQRRGGRQIIAVPQRPALWFVEREIDGAWVRTSRGLYFNVRDGDEPGVFLLDSVEGPGEGRYRVTAVSATAEVYRVTFDARPGTRTYDASRLDIGTWTYQVHGPASDLDRLYVTLGMARQEGRRSSYSLTCSVVRGRIRIPQLPGITEFSVSAPKLQGAVPPTISAGRILMFPMHYFVNETASRGIYSALASGVEIQRSPGQAWPERVVARITPLGAPSTMPPVRLTSGYRGTHSHSLMGVPGRWTLQVQYKGGKTVEHLVDVAPREEVQIDLARLQPPAGD